MAKLDLLEQTEITVGDYTYTVTAMPATEGLKWLEENRSISESGKSDLAVMKQVICKYATLGSMVIDEKKFNTHFARKIKQMSKLYREILDFNFPEEEEGFQEPDTEK